MKKNKIILLGIAAVVVIAVLIAVFKEVYMSSDYVMKLVNTGSDNDDTDATEFAVHEGDIVLDKGYRFAVLPGKLDWAKPVRKRKATNRPAEISDRLLRVKELNEDSAVIAILYQNTYYEGDDTIVTEETEEIRTVAYGETFYVYAKQQAMDDLSGGIMYCFAIEDVSSLKSKVQKYCTECGNMLTTGDKFCRECGTPVG